MNTPDHPDARPLLAMVNNVQTPYRLHLHQRIVREMPEVRIASLYTHGQPDQPWESRPVAEINPVLFGRDRPVTQQGRFRGMLQDWRQGGRIIRWLRENHAHAVVLGGYNDLTRLRLLRWCRAHRVPCFVFGDSNIHGDTAAGLKRILKKIFVGWVVRSASGLMPCGTMGRQYFERYGAAPDRCFFVPYEPDYDLIRLLPQSTVAQARADFSLDPARRRLVVSARLVRLKRVDLAIDAFAAIAADRPDWDLVIIGDGPQREALAARIPANLRPRVLFTRFLGDQSRISAIYRASHVLICPSDYEPWGVVVNEAAAAGLAIVASDVVGAAGELVRDGVNGRHFPAGDLPALTACLREVTDPSQIDRLRNGSQTVLASWRQRGDPIHGIRQALLSAGIPLPQPPP